MTLTSFAASWAPAHRWQRLLFCISPTVLPVLLALVAGRGGPAFYFGFAAVVAAFVGFVWFCRSQPVLLIGGVAIWLFGVRIILASMTGILTASTLSALLAYGHLFFPIIIAVLAYRVRLIWRTTSTGIRALDATAAAVLVVSLVAVLLGSDPIVDRLVYALRFTNLPVVYLAARLLPFTIGDVRSLAVYGLIAGTALAAFGILERFLVGGFVWGTIADPVTYYQMASYSGSARDILVIDGLPLTFWTFDGGALTRRLVSTSLEASTIAAFFGLVTTVAIAVFGSVFSGWRAILLVAIPATATVLTLGKAGIALGAMGVGYTIAARSTPALRRPVWIVGVGAAAVLGLILMGGLVEASGIASSVGAHLRGLGAGFDSLMHHPLGIGIGSTGVFAQQVEMSESALGVLMAQLGWPGILMWVPWIVGLGLMTIVNSDRIAGAPFVGLAVGAAVIAFFVVSMLTESANGLLWNWAFPLMAAAVLTEASSDRKAAVGTDV